MDMKKVFCERVYSILFPILFLILFLLPLVGCSNSLLDGLRTQLTTSTPTPTTYSISDKLIISSVSITGDSSTTATATPTPAPSTSTSSSNSTSNSSSSSLAPTATIYFDTAQSTTNISNHCAVSSSSSTATSRACYCEFSWTELNTIGDSYTPVAHKTKSLLTTVQPSAITCAAPQLYFSEISDGTPIKITLTAGASNTNLGTFTVPTYTLTKASGTTKGTFQDALGRSFINVSHYSCYNQFHRIKSVVSATTDVSNPREDAPVADKIRTVYLGSHFCTGGNDPSGGSVTCPTLTEEMSSQSYYFNFYIRSSESGGINAYNDSFVCPKIYEPLTTSSNLSPSSGQQGQYWPMDQTFSLSYSPTTDFPLGVDSNTKLSSSNDPTNTSTSCSGATIESSSGVTSSCLGFAARANPDGTCPFLKDASGKIQTTYRLRRYIALYPKVFQNSGDVFANQTQLSDTIYVLDRPVIGPANSDPFKPYTMRGPKPCPFAFYDQKGITNSTSVPSYLGSSSLEWNGKNIDGIEFPNEDSLKNKSCSATVPVPVYDPDLGTFLYWGMRTINKNLTTTSGTASPYSHLFVRPVTPFTPRYEEDMTFKACAPQASPLIDPPLHFVKYKAQKKDGTTLTDSGGQTVYNHAWCAESYPSQTDALNSLFAGMNSTRSFIRPFTSHRVKNSASAACTFSELRNIPTSTPSPYPTDGLAYHVGAWDGGTASQTCDRTVVSTSASKSGYPMLAAAAEVETSLKFDSSYRCTVTYDNGGLKSLVREPKDGCCLAGTINYVGLVDAAHLEPDVSCAAPNY